MPSAAVAPVLTPAEIERFERDGYVVLDGFFPPEQNARLIAECDARSEGRIVCDHVFEMPAHGALISDPRILALAEQVLGPGFHFTHFGNRRMEPGHGGVPWHQDLSQYPQSNRRHRQIGMLGYLSGLDGTIGDLVVIPGTQKSVMERWTLTRFGEAPLPGEVIVRCGPGSLAVLDAAMLHCRRVRPGGEGRWRYLLDLNFCQAGIRWPGQQKDWRTVLRRVRELGLDRGAHPRLIAEDVFFDMEEAERRMRELTGSLVMADAGTPP